MTGLKLNPPPLQRMTLSAQVAERLRDDILSGTFSANVQLNEKELSLAFGVSRGPLREAMQRLIQEGLLRSEPHRGVFVCELTEADLEDLFIVRSALEAAAVRRIVEAADRSAIARRLTVIAERMDRAVRGKRWKDGGDLDYEFHRTLVDAAESPRLSRTYASVQAETRLCLHRLMGGYRRSEELAEDHFRLARMLGSDALDAVLEELQTHFGDPSAIWRRVSTEPRAGSSRRTGP